mmetsp:Transcript_1972/g.2936  ORF Transcript_1972/g.2936 Transcript_1972/m.2936 type:complete len:130 (+) Transcript_1972:75-464(+)
MPEGTDVAPQGFKTAFYEYTEQHEKELGSQLNRVYSMAINIYHRLPDIEAAMKEVFSDSYEAEVRQPNMLVVLIFEHAIMHEKLKIGGMLARMVKDNVQPLRALLKANNPPEKEEQKRVLPKYAYLRLN